MERILTYDIGGTNTKYGLFSLKGDLLEKDQFPTAHGEALLPRLQSHAEQMLVDHSVRGIAIGIPGLVRDGIVRSAVNLGIAELPLAARLEAALHRPVMVGNDASLAALGEGSAGAARDRTDFLLVTLGTGVGTGIILGGQSFAGVHGAFGELGHTIVVPGGRRCSCGNRGCLEMYVSIKGLLANHRETTGEAVTIDELLRRPAGELEPTLDASARWLGLALANAATLLDLDTILLGGGLAELPELIRRADYWTNHFVLPQLRPITVVKASLGNDAALHGAFCDFMTRYPE